MSIRSDSLEPNATKISEQRSMTGVLLRLSQYVVWTELGLLGGAIGVGLAIGLAILIQSNLAPTMLFAPNINQLTLVATVVGLGVSWLLNRVASLILPSLFHHARRQGLQVMLVFSVFASLLQTFLFFTHGL